ncbi:hypothetical protein B5M09_006645 [Aphanomyces astaci]|uniref:CCDC81 HU domain-containing protein n=1 Tax=Aphanomyces astaci TaxID=112090 RepID=A0A3R7Y0G5_APHAT|nr:hypothetical protein B5M09_006645 [Aphanomyces astaci]
MGSSTALLLECKRELETSTYDYDHILASSVLDVWLGLTAHVERHLVLEKGLVVPVFGKFAFVKGKDVPTPTFAFTDKFLKSYRVTSKRPLPALTWHCGDVNYSTVAADARMMKDQAQHTVEAIFKHVGDVTQAGTRSCRLSFGCVGHIAIEGKCIAFRYDPAFLRTLQANKSQSSSSGNNIVAPSKQPTPTTHMDALEAMAGIHPSRQHASSRQQVDGMMLTVNNYMAPSSAITNAMVGSSPASNFTASAAAAAALSANTTSSDQPAHKHHHHHHHKHNTHSRQHKPAPSPQLMKSASDSAVLTVPTQDIRSHCQHHILPRFLLPETRPNPNTQTSHLQQLILEKAYARHKEAQGAAKATTDAMDAEYAQRMKIIEIRHLKDRATVALQHRDMHNHLQQQTLEKQVKAKEDHRLASTATTTPVTILPQARGRTKEEDKSHKAMLRRQLDAEMQKKRDRHDHASHVHRDEEVYFMAFVQTQHDKERQDVARQKLADKEALMREWSRQKMHT